MENGIYMAEITMRELNMLSICIRIILSLIIGGILGMERGEKIVRQVFVLIYWFVLVLLLL